MTESYLKERLFEEFGKNLDLVSVCPSNGGMSNSVWILHGRKRSYVVRIGKEGEDWRIQKEAALLSNFKGKITVPEVVDCRESSKNFSEGYLLMEHCTGRMASSSPSELDLTFFEEVAHALGKMHEQKYKIYGFLNETGNVEADPTITHSFPGPFSSAFEQMFLQTQGWFEHLSSKGSRYTPYLRILLERMEVYEPRFGKNAHFIHDDFSLKNILEEDSRLSAVIDFELAKAGDPCSDLHYFMFTGLDKGCSSEGIERFLESYRTEYGLPEGFQEKRNFMRYYYGFRMVITLKKRLELIPEEKHEDTRERLRQRLVSYLERTDHYLINDGI